MKPRLTTQRGLLPAPVHLVAVLFLLACSSCVRPALRSEEPFTIVMLPDTQKYSQNHPELFRAQTEWIKSNRERENIAFVTHIGDVVNDRKKSVSQWTAASEAMATLEDVVPWGVAIGNHDHDGGKDKTAATFFRKYFGPERFARFEWYGGAAPNGLSSYQLFSSGSMDFIILHLEIDVPDACIAWAAEILRRYPCRAAIISTHCYLMGREGVGRGVRPEYNRAGNSGEEIWDKLITRHPQIFMVLCGHEGKTVEYHQVSTNDTGNAVLEMLADYQRRANGGDGWLRLIRLVPATRRIEVRTYSPSRDEFETDADSQFAVPCGIPVAGDSCRLSGRSG